MNYSIEKVEELGLIYFCLYEHQTEQVIDYSLDEKNILPKLKFMNSGGAFDGFTPSFMLIPIPSKNINEEFDKYTR